MHGQSLIVFAIVSAALLYTARRGWKQLRRVQPKGKGGDCGCDGCGH